MDLRRLLDDGKPIFGTDGVRGVAGTELTIELARDIGRAAGTWLGTGTVLVGRDTRASGPEISYALQEGLNEVGVSTVDLGVFPTGGIAHLTAVAEADMGTIVSASHNPASDNGIKLLSSQGTKLPDDVEREIESKMRTRDYGEPGQGVRTEDPGSYERYISHLASAVDGTYDGLRLALDCANGSACDIAPEVFNRLGADVDAYFDNPDGYNINDGCGATAPEYLAAHAGGRIGLAFDGDADRLIAVDEDGEVANGDVIMAVIARHLKSRGALPQDTVVATVMSNLGFRKAMGEAGIEVIETAVGDRYVSEALARSGAGLGGEQSGHVIFPARAPTGDGLLTAIQLLNVVKATGSSLAELRRGALTEFPQVLVNVEMPRHIDVSAVDALWSEVRAVEADLGGDGRVLVRPSGTEPLLRIMVEAPTIESAAGYADRLANTTKDAIGS